MFEKLREKLPKRKSKEELDKRFSEIELEKGDMFAMLIAALITFGPMILIVSIIFVGIALLF